MDDRKMAFSAMLISTALFLAIGFLDYYALMRYHGWGGNVAQITYEFLARFELLTRPFYSRLLLLMIVTGSVMLYNPKKKEGKSFGVGLLIYLLGCALLTLSDAFVFDTLQRIWGSLSMYFLGFLFSLSGAIHLFQVMNFTNASKKDPFNEENETFLQMEERIETPYSVNIPYEYRYKKKIRKGWINFVNLFRALLIIGTPGSGKSFALIEEIIEQLINKLFSLLIYDFKFDTLSKITYNYWLRKKEHLKNNPEKLALLPEFYVICFDNVEKSHRCNPINPYLLKSQTDASDAATIIMKNLNREWIKRNDFFSKSAISFVSGLIWYLKKKSEERGINICTLPHVIILSTVNIEYLLRIMLVDIEVRSLMIPFKDALEREAVQQLAGQTASAQISLSMLANREIFYIMTGNDFQLDLNNLKKPKILCIQNNPDRSEIYSAPIGLYINKILQVVNKPGGRPLGLILDELPTIFIMGLRKIIDTGRSHYVATILGIQSITQLIADYGKELAEVIFDNCSNVFSGAAKGETARRMSEIFGKIHQEKQSKTISRNDTTTNISTSMLEILPKSKITGMSTGHFGGIVADTFENPIKNKLSYGLVKPNMESKKIQAKYDIPIIQNFKLENHDALVSAKMKSFRKIKLYNSLAEIDVHQVDYIDFYNNYLEDFAGKHYQEQDDRETFIALVKELSLFDHLQTIDELINGGNLKRNLEDFIFDLVDRMFVQKEIDTVLNDNFAKVLHDIDELVRDEYYEITGENLESAIFDKNKIGDEVDEAINQERQVSYHYTQQLETADSTEKPTFDGNDTIEDARLFVNHNEDDNIYYSSYPVEEIQSQ